MHSMQTSDMPAASCGSMEGVVRPGYGAQFYITVLLFLFVVDISSILIDVFSLPLPARIMGLPLSFIFAILVALYLYPGWRRQGLSGFLSSWEWLAIVCGGLGLVMSLVRNNALDHDDLVFVISFIPLGCAFVLVRVYRNVFGDVNGLVSVFILSTILLGFVQVVLLFLQGYGVASAWINYTELGDRNGMGVILGMALWLSLLQGFFHAGNRMAWIAMLAFVFALVLVNHSRGGAVLVSLVGIMAIGFRVAGQSWWRVTVPIALMLLTVMVSIFAFPVLEMAHGYAVFGSGDSALSTQYRVKANWDLLQELFVSPWTGVGAQGAFSVRSGGYISHTLFLLCSATVGVVVFAVSLMLLVLRIGVCTPQQRFLGLSTFSMIVLSMAFVNDPLPVYGFVLAVVLQGGYRIVGRGGEYAAW